MDGEKQPKPQLPPLSDGMRPEQLIKRIHSAEGQLAEHITNFAGSMLFAYIHVVWFFLWIFINHGFLRPFVEPFDPFPYGLLTMIVSLEAIFLSTFIMVAQNRQELVDTYRELEDEQVQKEEEEQQEELEHDVQELGEDVQDIQKDMDEIQKDLDKLVKGMTFMQQKLTNIDEKNKATRNKENS